MGKTYRSEKGAGYEYWSRRNYKDMTRPGKISKEITKRAERRKAKQEKRDE